MPSQKPLTKPQLQRENDDLRARLAEAEETLRAIRQGEVDALVVSGPQGDRIFSLSGAETVYRVIVETMHEAALTVDPEGTILFCNRQFADLVRTPLEAISGRRFAQFAPPPMHQGLSLFLSKARTASARFRMVLGAADGTIVHVQASASPLEVAGAGSVCILLADLTELERSSRSIAVLRQHQQALEEQIGKREQAEQALRQERDRARRYLETADVMLLGLDLEGRVTLINRKGCAILEWEEQELLGRNWIETCLPESVREPVTEKLRRLQGGDISPVENLVLTKSGQERLIAWRNTVIRDETGHIISTLSSGDDITERRRGEVALRRSRQGLSLLAEASLQVMRQTSLEAMFEAMSAAALQLTDARLAVTGHGYVNGQFVVGGSARAPGMGDCPPEKQFIIEKGGVYLALLEGGADTIVLTDAEMRAHPRWWGLPGGHVPMRGLLGVRLVDGDGRTNGMILVSHKNKGDFTVEDATLLQQLGTLASLATQHVTARISLEEADRGRNQFLAVLSHELRNPLAPIHNSLFMLDHAAPGSEQAQRAKAVIDRQVAQLSRLVDDLLDVTRITSNKIALQRGRFDLAELLRRTAEDYRSVFATAGVGLGLRMREQPLLVHADAERVSQAVGNLLQNAAKFSDKGGLVTLRLEEDTARREAVIRVRDTGIGMSPDVLQRLFQPFAQADHSLSRAGGGLGLGLTIVKGLAELHRGTVEARSDGIGRGSEFTIRLPLRQEETVWEPAVPRPAKHSAWRVLIIEDNVDAADMLREVLALNGHAVEVAHDGPEGLAKAREFEVQVVLCDIGLPGMSGYEVARAFRADPKLRSVFLVALTGYALPEDMEKTREAGFDHHLVKPLSPQELEEVLVGLSSAERRPGAPM